MGLVEWGAEGEGVGSERAERGLGLGAVLEERVEPHEALSCDKAKLKRQARLSPQRA